MHARREGLAPVYPRAFARDRWFQIGQGDIGHRSIGRAVRRCAQARNRLERPETCVAAGRCRIEAVAIVRAISINHQKARSSKIRISASENAII